jgi:hypothetical protein
VTSINVLTGPNAGGRLDTDAQDVTIGSDPEQCDLVLLDPSVLPRHMTVHTDEAGFTELRPIEFAIVTVENQGVLQGPMRLSGPVCVRAGDTELLIRPSASDRIAASEPDIQEADETPQPDSPRTTRSRTLMIAGCAVGCVALLWTLLSVMSTSPTADSSRVPATARSAGGGEPIKPLRTESHEGGLDNIPSVRSYDRGGSVLLETPAAPPPAAAPGPSRRTLSKLADGPAGPYLETQQGDRYPLSSPEGEGYSIHWQSDDEIILRRGSQSITVRIE